MKNVTVDRFHKALTVLILVLIAQNKVYGQQPPPYWASPGGVGYCLSTPRIFADTPVAACNGMAQNLVTTCGQNPSGCVVRGVWTPYSDQPDNGWCSVQQSCNGGPFGQTDINGGGGNVNLICAADHVYWQNQCIPILDTFSLKPLNACYGNPIYPMIGAKIQDESMGQSVAGQNLSMRFSSQWSQLQVGQPIFGLTILPSLIGEYVGSIVKPFWSLSIDKRLYFQTDPNGNILAIQAYRGSAHWESFYRVNLSGIFAPDPDVRDSIIPVSGGYQLRDADNLRIEVYDSSGALDSIAYADGGAVNYIYSTGATPTNIAPKPGLLIGIVDHFGRSLSFNYRSSPLGDGPELDFITGPDQSVTSITNDPNNGNIISIQWPDTNSRQFIYDQANVPWALTGILDENGARYATFTYDNNGIAVETQHAGSVYDFKSMNSAPPQWNESYVFDAVNLVVWRKHTWAPPTGEVIQDPMGNQIALSGVTVQGTPQVTSRSQPAGSGCNASISNSVLDGNGNVTSSDDFNGNRVCYAYDTERNLQTVELEGFAGGANGKTCPASLSSYTPSPADAAHPERKTTTVWHPDWALKAQEAAPKKITTWVYNGQPDPIAGGTAACVAPATTLPDGKPLALLCARYEQATTDTTGALGLSATVSGATRAWTYTYNQY